MGAKIDDEKQHEIQSVETTTEPKPYRIPPGVRRNIANIRKWGYYADVIKKFFKEEKRSIVPGLIKKFGDEPFVLYKDSLYFYGRKVITDQKEKASIIDKEEGLYGGKTKAFDRIARKYIGISRSDVEEAFRGSERRQLKARYQKTKSNNTYIYRGMPGSIQIDLTFYKNQKYPVFGAIDIFSRWAWYKRVPDKRASSVIVYLKEFIAEFEKVSNFKVTQIATDSGVEFAGPWFEYLKKQKIFYDRQVKARKIIEKANLALRTYIERVGWSLVSDLDKLIESFVETYNDSKHATTKRVPNDLVRIEKKDLKVASRAQRKAAAARVAGGKEFKTAKLKIGDVVRLYDPRRVEIKAEQKERLKGKVKLSENDYVKKYTSHHRGQTPHWTKKVFKISKIIESRGGRAARYFVEGKKSGYFRHEVQKAYPVKKKDQRLDLQRKRDAAKKEWDEKRAPDVRKAKYVRKEIIVHYAEEDAPRKKDPAYVLDVYKNYMIVFHDSYELSFINEREFVEMTGEVATKANIKTWINDNPDGMARARREIDETIQEIRDGIPNL